MNRFQNKIVMGGSDIESESDDEYIPGPEMMYQQYMYNATVYNVMMLSMMPCVPMQCIPPYGCASPYPPITNQFPVNHMAAGPNYENRGRSRRHTRKSRSKGDENVKYKPHHRQHPVVQCHQYYQSSSKSDDEDECPDTVKKGPYVSHTADKSFETLGHLTEVLSTKKQQKGVPSIQQKVDNAANLPLPQNSRDIITDSDKNSQLQIPTNITAITNTNQTSLTTSCIPESAAYCNKMPFNNLESKTAGCQGQNATPDVKIAANLPLKYVVKEAASSQNNSKFTHQSATSAETVLLNNMTRDTQGDESRPAENHLPLSNYSPHDFIVNKSAEDSQLDYDNVSKFDGSSSDSISGHSLTEATVTSDHSEGHDLDQTGSMPADESHPDDRQLGDEASGRSGVDRQKHMDLLACIQTVTPAVQPANSRRGSHGPHYRDHGGKWRNEVIKLKDLQSLHSLRKAWLEWETKFRPPPVSIYNLRGADPYNV